MTMTMYVYVITATKIGYTLSPAGLNGFLGVFNTLYNAQTALNDLHLDLEWENECLCRTPRPFGQVGYEFQIEQVLLNDLLPLGDDTYN